MQRVFNNFQRQSAIIFNHKRLSIDARYSTRKLVDGPFPIAYNSKMVESEWYAWWISEKLFEPSSANVSESNPMNKFTMVLPPPNVTGDLHVGHALAVTIQDVLQRWQRSRGSSCHWIPGFDHAGIATQVVVEKKIKAVTPDMDKHRMGKDAFLHEVRQWSNVKRQIIKRQLQSLGASLDWSCELFTMDDDYSRAVTEAFVRLYEAGLIKRNKTLVNWCCHLGSTISDMEIEHMIVGGASRKTYKDPSHEVPISGDLYRFAYKLSGSDEEIVVSTTRPETILGDVAVAVNPKDSRFVRFLGRFVVHPFDGRLLPVIDDDHVDPAFGTGALKVTPGHSHEDFALIKKHHGQLSLQILNILDEKGNVVASDSRFHGMNRFAARTVVIQELSRLGLFRGKENHEVALPVCSRSGGIVEPLLKSQWFLETSDMTSKIKIQNDRPVIQYSDISA